MCRDLSGVVHAPERSWLQRLWREIQHWQEVLNEQLNQFSGDVLLSRQEDLKSITSLVGRGGEEGGFLRFLYVLACVGRELDRSVYANLLST